MTVFDWLHTKVGKDETVLKRLAWLVFHNHGKLLVDGRGKTALQSLNDILELQAMSGCLDGFIKANDGKDWDGVKALLEEESALLSAAENTDVAARVAQSLNPRS